MNIEKYQVSGGNEKNENLGVVGALFDGHVQGVVLEVERPDLIRGTQRLKIDGCQGFTGAIDNGDILYRDDAGGRIKRKLRMVLLGKAKL